jgi:hypothetical protein
VLEDISERNNWSLRLNTHRYLFQNLHSSELSSIRRSPSTQSAYSDRESATKVARSWTVGRFSSV